MSEVLLFTPLAGKEPKENLRRFNRFCREELTVYGSELLFDDVSWNISASVTMRAHKKAFRVYFTDSDPRHGAPPLRAPFAEFARSYLRYSQGLKPVEFPARRLAAMRVIHHVLSKNDKVPCVTRLSTVALNQAATEAARRFKPKVAYQVGCALEQAAALIQDLRISRHSLAAWRNPIPKEKDIRNRVGREFDERRAEKLISDSELNALSRAYLIAAEPVEQVFSSLAVLMSCAPDRINEVLSLPFDCEVEQKGSGDEASYGLRWPGSKGKKDFIKLIPATMAPFAREAVRRLRSATTEARRIAAWYEAHPDRLYLPERLAHLRNREFLDAEEFAAIAAVSSRHKGDWYGPRGVEPSSIWPWRIRLSDVERALLKELPAGFPILDKKTGLRFSEALCVVQENFTRTEWSLSPCLVTQIGINQVNQQLGSRVKHGCSSIFSRNGITLPDGSPVSLTTGQFRHFLNTLAQSAGVGQFAIALWSGRQDEHQNSAYDHVPAEDLLDEVDELFDRDLATRSRSVAVRSPLSVQQMRWLDVSTAHTTDTGVCVHDFVLLPCQHQLECDGCADHVYVKGDADRNERVRLRHEFHSRLLARAEDAVANGTMGANRWVEHHRAMVNRLSGLVKILDDQTVPDGALLRLAKSGAATLLSEHPTSRPLLSKITGPAAVAGLLAQADALQVVTDEDARQQSI